MTMNLSGSLEAFGLDEVLSLLGMGGRTARMQVSSAQGTGSVHLVDGHVTAASADLARAGLLRELVAASDVPADDLAAALGQAEPVVSLVDGGVVSRDLAHRVAVEHIVDALGEMLAWHEGEFAVWAGEADPADIGVRLPVHEAVDRGRARVQEWARVHEALPGQDSVLALVPELGEPPVLGVEDWAVLARVDGRRTLAEVLAAVGIAPLVASDRVVQLMGRGLVRVRAQDVAEPDEVAAMIDAFEGRSEPADPAPVVMPVLVDEGQPVAPAQPVDVEELPHGEAQPQGSSSVSMLLPEETEPEETEPEAPVATVPVLLEEPVPPPASPWQGAVQPVEVTDPAVTAWLESATPAQDLVALVGQVPGDAPAPAEAPVDPVAEPVFSFPVQVEPDVWAPAVDELVVAPAPEPAVAPAVEWSPWAQALGLGAPAPEGELIVDPLAGPGIAEMIADAHGLADTSDVPVPQVPVVPAAPVDQSMVPAPRAAEGQTWTVEAAGPAAVPVADGDAGPEAEAEAEAPAEAPDVAPAVAPSTDPLSGGLLSQLMSGVRGL